MLKPCSCGSREAVFSVVCVISSVGIRPRRQKCSTAVLFCRECMADLLADDGRLWADRIRESVNNAYTHVGGPPEDRTDQENEKREAPNG